MIMGQCFYNLFLFAITTNILKAFGLDKLKGLIDILTLQDILQSFSRWS